METLRQSSARVRAARALTPTLAIVCLAFGATACGSALPRNVRESFHHDHPECRGRDIGGEALGPARYRVEGCGWSAVYVCPTGEHSRWRPCRPELPE